jgi:WD40 repeat protein
MRLSGRSVTCWVSMLVLTGLLGVGCGVGRAAERGDVDCSRAVETVPDGLSRPRAFGSFALTSDGARLAVTVDDGRWSGLFVYDVGTAKLLWRRELSAPASSMALSPGGHAVAVAYTVRPSGCPHVEPFNGDDGHALPALEDRAQLSSVVQDGAQAVTFGPDDALVAAALDNEVRVWNVSSGRNAFAIQPPGIEGPPGIEPIEELAFTPDGKRIAGVSMRRPAVYLWELSSQHLERAFALRKFPGSLGGIVFNDDGSLLAAGSTGPLALWNTRSGALIGEIAKPAAGPIGPISFLNDTKLVVNGPGKLELWDVSKHVPSRDPDWKSPTESVDTAFAVGSRNLVGIVSNSTWDRDAGSAGQIRLVAIPSGNTIASLEVPGRPATAGPKFP